MQFRALLVGDVVGRPGRKTVRAALPDLLTAHSIDVVVVNAENAAGGSGITPPIFKELRDQGVDVVTMGDHVYRRKEIVPTLKASDRILRPANLPAEAAGHTWAVHESESGFPFAVTIVLGRTFMKPASCPFHAVDAVLEQVRDRAKLIFVEVHAEASSDRIAMGWHLDGRVTCVYGTHTHVQTADERVLPGGTAFLSDLGMTGPHDGVLGRRRDKVIPTLITGMPRHFDVATGDLRLHGALVTADTETGLATAIERIAVPVESEAEAEGEKEKGQKGDRESEESKQGQGNEAGEEAADASSHRANESTADA
jgi:hypothetical protein